ncbi:MAG: DUF4911 domain-containing protein [bacterium]|nr:DUF4911 domain-containing protein [bacterium]
MPLSPQYKAPGKSLACIKNLFEGYDNLLVMTMIDVKNGIFTLVFSEGMAYEAGKVIEGIKKEVNFEEL